MIEVFNLSYQYELKSGQSITALQEIRLTIGDGEYVAIMGPNSSGKSTLARCLNGLLHPTSGEIVVDGFHLSDLGALWEIRRRVGMVFQDPDSQLVSPTVERELAFGLENLGLPPEEIQKRVEETLQRFDLREYRFHPPHRLSGGEKQRVAIAAVLAMEPKYLILDEPTSLLDPQGRQELLSLLDYIRAAEGITVVLITQFSEEALRADRLVVLADGQVVGEGPPRKLFAEGDGLTKWGIHPPGLMELAGKLRREGLEVGEGTDGVEDFLQRLKALGVDGGAMPQKVSSEREPELSLTGNPQIAVESLSYTYDPGLPTEREALSSVELQVHPGECLGLIGPSGSGKTTLTQHFNGLLQPTQGRVLVDGIDLSIKRIDLKPIRQKIGLVFQSPEFQLFEDTVYADVAFGPRSLGWSPAEVDRRVREALGGVGLDFEVFAHRSPFSLSQGEKRRVAIAGVLALGPQVLILDEPTAGLDPQGVKQMVAILRELQTRGTTLIVISHHLEFIARLAQRAIVLHRGQVVAEGPFPGVLLEGGLLENLGFGLPPLVALGVKLWEWGWELGPDGFTPEGIKEGLLRNLWEAKSPSSERDHTYPL